MYKIHYSNINLETMIGGNKPGIKSLKGLNLFPKGTQESKLLNPTNGYEWSINATRNYFYFGESNNPITKLVKKCYHEDGILHPSKFFLDNKAILRNIIGRYLGFYFFYFTNKTDIDRLIKIGAQYHISKNWPKTGKIEESIKNILRQIAKYNRETFDEDSIYKKNVTPKSLSVENKTKIDKYLALDPQTTKIKDFFRQTFKMSTSSNDGPIYNQKQLEGIFSVALAILWEIANDRSGIKEYYEGINVYIPIDIPSDFEDTKYTNNQLLQFDASISNDYNYILAYLNSKIKSLLSIQTQQTAEFTINGVKIDYADCGEISLKNFIKILCFDVETDKFNITLLDELEPIDDIKNFFTIFDTDDLHSSDAEKLISFTSGYTATMSARNAWAYLVSNREGVSYLQQTEEGFGYELDQVIVDDEPNMFILLKQLFKKPDLEWEDFDNDIDVDLEYGIGSILFKDNSYKWVFQENHYYTERINSIVSFDHDNWTIDDYEEEKLNYLYNLVYVNESFNKKLFYHYDWKDNNILLQYFNMLTTDTLAKLIKFCNGNISNIDSEYTRLFKYIHERFMYDQKRRINLDLSKLDIDDYIFNQLQYNIIKYYWIDTSLEVSFKNNSLFDNPLGDSLDNLTSLQSLTFGGGFNQNLDKSLHKLTSLQSLTFGTKFNQRLGNSLHNLSSLQSLTFGIEFNQYLDDSLDKLTSLEKLAFGESFDQPLFDSLSNLQNLQSLTFGENFNQSLGNSLDKLTSLQSLTFGNFYNQPLGNSLDKLTSLQSLDLGDFDHPLGNSLDKLTNLQSLNLGRLFNHPLDTSLDKLTNLKSLTLSDNFYKPLGNSLDKLTNLQLLTFGRYFNQYLGDSLNKLTNLQSLTFGQDFNHSLGDSLNKLIKLQSLTFGRYFEQSLDDSLDKLTSLEKLTFGGYFNQYLGESLSNLINLQSLTFGDYFVQNLGNSLDNLTNLQSLTFGLMFNMPLDASLSNLTNLQSLTFGERFDLPLVDSLDNLQNLHSLTFGMYFNQDLGISLSNLQNLKSLTFGKEFNKYLDHSLDKLTNLQSLTFGYKFNLPLGDNLNKLTNLQSLTFGERFDLSLDYSLDKLTNLKSLTFGGYFNEPLGNSLDKLTSLESLTFSKAFNQSLGNSLYNLTSLKSLTLGENFNINLDDSLNKLINLESLTFGYNFSQPLGNSLDNLINLKSLTFGQEFNHPLTKILKKLTNLQSLTISFFFNYFIKKYPNINFKFLGRYVTADYN